MDLYNIQIMAKIAGVSAHTIRAWEKRYKALSPKRQENGRRLYSEHDVERLGLLVKLSNMGNSIGTIARLSDEELHGLYNKLSGGKRPLISKESSIDPDEYIRPIMLSITTNKWDIFSHEIDKCIEKLPLSNLINQLLLPLHRNLKERLKEDELTIGQFQLLEQLLINRLRNIHLNDEGDACLISLPGNVESQLEGIMMAIVCSANNLRPFILHSPAEVESLVEMIKFTAPIFILIEGAFGDEKELISKIPTTTLLMIKGQLNAQKQFQWQRQGVEVISSVAAFQVILSRILDQRKHIEAA